MSVAETDVIGVRYAGLIMGSIALCKNLMPIFEWYMAILVVGHQKRHLFR